MANVSAIAAALKVLGTAVKDNKLSKKEAMDLKDIFNAFSKGRPTIDTSDPKIQENFTNTRDQVRGLMLGDPTSMAIQAGAMALGEGLNAAGDIAKNNGNRLAAALMARSRNNSERQNSLYGPSTKEKAAEAWGQERMRRGDNLARGLHAGSNLVNKLLGTYQMANNIGTTTAIGNTFGNIPSAGFDMASQAMRTGSKL